MTVHLVSGERPFRRTIVRSGWALSVVLAVALGVQHRLLIKVRAELKGSRQEAARLRLIEQDLYRLKQRQDLLLTLLQVQGWAPSEDSSRASALQEASSPFVAPLLHEAEDLHADDPVPHLWPVSGWVTQEFRPPKSPRHEGVDIAERLGTPVVAPARGEVVRVYWDDTMGRVLEIQHAEGHLTRYAHLQTVEVQPGETVEAGQVVARLGTSGKSTAPHLHYEVELRGELLDPGKFLPHFERYTASGVDTAP